MNLQAARPDRFRPIAIGVWLATLAIALGAVVLIALSLSADIGPSWGFRGFAVLFATTFGTVGVLINLRVPGNRVGWLFAGIGLASALQEFVAAYVAYGILTAPGALPLVNQIAWLVAWDWVPFAGASTTFLPLLFPDGRLPSPHWRPVAWLALGSISVVALILAITPGPISNARFADNPLGVAGFDAIGEPLFVVSFITLALAIVLSAASVVVRFRRSRGSERAQLKWFASSAVLAGLTLAGPGTLFNLLVTGSPTRSNVKAFEILTIIALLAVPVSAGIAILRYRLYDIDRIISRTIAYAVVTATLVAAYATAILLLQGPLQAVTGGETISVAISTLLVAALFQPVRLRIQSAVDRRFHRARYDAERTAAAFSERLREQVDIEAVTADLDETVRAAMGPGVVGLWLREGTR